MADKSSKEEGVADKPGDKASSGDKKDAVESPPVGGELLSLLESVGEIDRSSALRELKVSGETLDLWVDQLSKEDWIWVSDRELGEYYIGLTDNSRERISQLKELRKREESVVDEKQVKQKTGLKKAVAALMKAIRAVPTGLLSSLASNIVDLSIVAGLVTLGVLLYPFLRDPNRFIINFLVGMILFSQIVLTYRGSRKKLKAKTLMKKLLEFNKTISRNWRGAVFMLLSLLLLYFTGWAVISPAYRALSILACTIVISSIIQLYYPPEPLSKAPRFYAGTLLIVYSMLLLTGTTKITPLLLEYESRVVDAAAGILLMALVYVKRDFFGIEQSYFNSIMSQEDG